MGECRLCTALIDDAAFEYGIQVAVAVFVLKKKQRKTRSSSALLLVCLACTKLAKCKMQFLHFASDRYIGNFFLWFPRNESAHYPPPLFT